MPDDPVNQPNNPISRGTERTFNSLEKHLTDKIASVEANLTNKIDAVKSDLTDKILNVEKFFNAETRGQKEAVTIAMTASDRASAKTEDTANERTKEVLKRLDLIDTAIAESGGWNRGVGSSMGTIFQIISSLGVIIGLIVIIMQHH